MPLTTAEIWRVRAELGYHVLTSSAEPYISYIAIFDQIVKPYTSTGYATTSATAVTAASSPTVVTLTLADATGFAAGDRVAIDVDDMQERVTVRSVSGSTISVALRLGHTAGYPVVQEGGESIIREILANIRTVRSEMAQTFGTGALKKVDEIEWYESRGRTAFGNLGEQLKFWREELASAIGVASMWSMRRGGAQRLAAY